MSITVTTPAQWRLLDGLRAARTIRPAVAIAILFILLLLLAAAWPSALTGFDPLATDPRHAFAAPNAQHILGTDENGRDVWARLVYGARPSLLLGIGSSIIIMLSGILLGLAAGLGPRLVDGVLMRVADVLQSVPQLLLVLIIVALWGISDATLLLGLAIGIIPLRARQVRAQVLVIRRAHFVEAAHTLGIPSWLVVLRHVVPNSIKPVLVLFPLEIGWQISMIATLSFIGVGAAPPAPLWGTMLAIDRDYVLNAWWLTALPAAVITLTVIAVNIIGRELIRRSEGK